MFAGSAFFSRGVTVVGWNPADTNGLITLSNSNLTATGTNASNPGAVRAKVSHAAGKYYWEVRLDAKSGGSSDPWLGIILLSDTLGTSYGPFSGNSGEYGMYSASPPSGGHFDYAPGANTALNIAPAVAAGDVFMLAADLILGKIWFGRNGTWDQGDPATGTSPRSSGLSGTFSPFVALVSSDTVTAHFKASSFVYTPPAGFSPW